MGLKSISFILCFISISHVLAAESQTKSDVRINNNDGGKLADVDARISLILVDENKDQKSYRWGITRETHL